MRLTLFEILAQTELEANFTRYSPILFYFFNSISIFMNGKMAWIFVLFEKVSIRILLYSLFEVASFQVSG